MAYGLIQVDKVENSDGKSLNVGPSARVFDTVTDLQASTTLSDGDIVVVKERANAEYKIQPSTYTALDGDLTLTSGQVADLQLKPVNDARWWGVVGDGVLANEDDLTAKDESQLADSGTDNKAAITSALTRLAGSRYTDRNPKCLSLDVGGPIGISSPIYLSKNWAFVQVIGGYLFALPDFSGDVLFRAGDESWSGSESAWKFDFIDVVFDARFRTNCFWLSRCSRFSMAGCNTVNFDSYGVRTTINSGEFKVTRHSSYEVPFALGSDMAYSDRQGYSYLFETSDFILSDSIGAVSKIPIYVADGYNYQVSNCHFWVGDASDAPYGDVPCVLIEAEGGTWTNIYLDEGIIQIRDAFNTRLLGVNATSGTYGDADIVLQLITTNTDEDGRGFHMSGVSTDRWSSSNQVQYLTEESGSWSDYKKCDIGTIIDGESKKLTTTTMWSGKLVNDNNWTVIRPLLSDDNSTTHIDPIVSAGTRPGLCVEGSNYALPFAAVSNNVPSGVWSVRRSGYSDITTTPTANTYLAVYGATSSNGTDVGSTDDNTIPYLDTTRGKGFLSFRATGDWDSSSSMGVRAEVRVTPPNNGSDGTASQGYAFNYNDLSPITDDYANLGQSSVRWSNIYASNGTINTSDARLKTDLVELTDDEVNAAVAISKKMGYTWQWLENGDRTHTGPTVQLIMGIMEENNLNPFDYSFICYDEWDEQTEAVEVTPAVLDDEGNVVTEAAHEDQVVIEAGDRYSFRENELIKFCNAGLSARLDSQQEAIDSILSRLDNLEG